MPLQKRVTIAQISDLHINRKVRKPIKDMMKLVLQKAHPDILIVTGDLTNQPVWWQMRDAAQLVREIQKACSAKRLFVIPGNHDYKIYGNFGLRRLSRIPFEIYFRRDGLNRRWFWHVTERLRLVLNALYWRGRSMREPVIVYLSSNEDDEHNPEKNWGLALFAINSTGLSEMMAAGKVESEDLQQLYKEVDKASGEPDFAFRYTIGLVHHHPAPIADAPFEAVDRIQDSFMIFYNAGLFVRELSRRGFNLVLHGHKHVAGFLRVACDFDDLGRTVLPIAAAGTATHPQPDDPRGHHLRIIEIFDDDTASLHEHFFEPDVERTQASFSIDLETVEDVRRRRFAIFNTLRKYSAREVVKKVEIMSDGYTKVEIKELDCRAVKSGSIDKIPISLTTERPSYIRDVSPSQDSSAFVEIKFSEKTLYRVAGNLPLGKNWAHDDCTFDFGYRYRLMNGHVLKPQEFARHYSSSDEVSESATITCDGACELLTLNVQFPQNYDLKALEFRATAEYVPAPLRGSDDVRLDYGRVKPHDKETARIGGSIRPENNGYVFTCPNPVPGMIYRLKWTFKSKVLPRRNLSIAAGCDALRKRLLTMAANAPTTAKAEYQRVQSRLTDLGSDFDGQIAGPSENLSVSLMVFDDTDKTHQRLRFVCTTSDKLRTADFFSGESCAGFAFEKARYILYHEAADQIGYFIKPTEWPQPAQLGSPIVLACFPWFFDPVNEPDLVAGVVNLSAMSPTTKLLSLFDPESEQAVKMKRLQDLVQLLSV